MREDGTGADVRCTFGLRILTIGVSCVKHPRLDIQVEAGGLLTDAERNHVHRWFARALAEVGSS